MKVSSLTVIFACLLSMTIHQLAAKSVQLQNKTSKPVSIFITHTDNGKEKIETFENLPPKDKKTFITECPITTIQIKTIATVNRVNVPVDKTQKGVWCPKDKGEGIIINDERGQGVFVVKIDGKLVLETEKIINPQINAGVSKEMAATGLVMWSIYPLGMGIPYAAFFGATLAAASKDMCWDEPHFLLKNDHDSVKKNMPQLKVTYRLYGPFLDKMEFNAAKITKPEDAKLFAAYDDTTEKLEEKNLPITEENLLKYGLSKEQIAELKSKITAPGAFVKQSNVIPVYRLQKDKKEYDIEYLQVKKDPSKGNYIQVADLAFGDRAYFPMKRLFYPRGERKITYIEAEFKDKEGKSHIESDTHKWDVDRKKVGSNHYYKAYNTQMKWDNGKLRLDVGKRGC